MQCTETEYPAEILGATWWGREKARERVSQRTTPRRARDTKASNIRLRSVFDRGRNSRGLAHGRYSFFSGRLCHKYHQNDRRHSGKIDINGGGDADGLYLLSLQIIAVISTSDILWRLTYIDVDIQTRLPKLNSTTIFPTPICDRPVLLSGIGSSTTNRGATLVHRAMTDDSRISRLPVFRASTPIRGRRITPMRDCETTRSSTDQSHSRRKTGTSNRRC